MASARAPPATAPSPSLAGLGPPAPPRAPPQSPNSVVPCAPGRCAGWGRAATPGMGFGQRKPGSCTVWAMLRLVRPFFSLMLLQFFFKKYLTNAAFTAFNFSIFFHISVRGGTHGPRAQGFKRSGSVVYCFFVFVFGVSPWSFFPQGISSRTPRGPVGGRKRGPSWKNSR